jgi:di/tricarboxylate transporter
MSDIAVVYLILAVAVVLFVSGKVPVGLVAIGVALALWATGVLTLEAALSGFGDPTVLFIASLFVVSEGLDATGVTAWAGQQLIDRGGTTRSRLVLLTMLLVAVLTAVISVNGAVAALLPVVVVIAVRTGRSPSQLLLPLVFGAHAGSMLTLTGTPVNVIVSQYALELTGHGFGFFEFALAGVPLLLGAIAVTLVAGSRLVPERRPKSMPADLSRHARTLVRQYGLEEGVSAFRVTAGSSLVGRLRADLEPGSRPDVTIVGVEDADGATMPVERPLAAGDRLLVQGPDEGVATVTAAIGLEPDTAPHIDVAATLLGRSSGLAEIIIPPRSPLIGETVFPGMVTQNGTLVVLAVQRQATELAPGEVALEAGDTILLQGAWEAIEEHAGDRRVLAVDSPELVRRQAVPLGPGAGRALLILGAMILALATGVVPSAVAGLVAAGALVLTGVLKPEAAYRGISWTTVVLVAGMIPLSTAMTQTGAAGVIADALVAAVGNLGPYALLAGLFAVTAVFGQLISNMATALIVIPIAIAAATELGVDVRPVLMSVTIAASAAYLTPVATPVNLMVMGPAGYRFGDYWKLGLPLLGVTFLVAVFLVPLIWPF